MSKYKVDINGLDTSKIKVLKNTEMVKLFKQLQNEGDESAREKLVFGNLRLVLSVLKRFNQRGENMDDLFQVGCLGLIKAIDNFDLKHQVKFSTYAVPMIIGEIRRYLRDNSSIRVSRSLKDIAYKVLQVRERFVTENQREPTEKEIATILEIDPIDVILSLEAIQDPVSIYTPIYSDGGDTIHLIDQIQDDKNDYQTWSQNVMIENGLKKLESREKRIIYERYFLGKTQMEIADEIGISQAQVSRLEKNALKQMHNHLH
ncbi:RNA polymerase sporulation sigma factor SigG [Haloplasma contractile]|uniref:RNA polymerase sigma factor n=1 Tax=Haloplasma contractile SSD-17B TaxID=1033810 RepID=U2DZI1_9MOLU|nr:RNA polymerase sporulation sigma factor SigG [Haloplasma contractile]ERJ13607.1 RNA polymerase sigma-G factor protein [Haloplasma contractile SSD-17B]